MGLTWRLAVLAILAVPGCAANAGSAPATPPPGDEVAFSVGTSGGMTPAISQALASPSVLIYADGRMLTKVNSLAIQTVPARYEIARLGPDAVAAFVSSGAAVVDPGIDFGTAGVTDAGTTTVTLHSAHGAQQVNVYALDETFDTGLSPAQQGARAALRSLIDRANALPGDAARSPYTPDRVVVYELDSQFTKSPATVGWPGPPPTAFLTPSTKSRSVACGELVADPAEQVYRAALENPGALWLVDGVTRILAVNPLPLADTCP
ncbi:MAG: hypothetical protein ACOYBX_12780 [Mycobacterium sp.]